MSGKRSRLITIAAAGTIAAAAGIAAVAGTLPSGSASPVGAADARLLAISQQQSPAAAAQGATMNVAQLVIRSDQVRYVSEHRQAQAELAAAAKAAAAKKAAAARAAAQQKAAQQPVQQLAVTTPSGSPQQIAEQMLSQFGWSSSQFSCLEPLWAHESGWNVYASNPSSGAYGIPQALPGSKMASAGPDWESDAATQIRWGLEYIQGTYGSPCSAWAHEEADGWY